MQGDKKSSKDHIFDGMSDFFGDMFGTMGIGPRKGRVAMTYPFGNRARGMDNKKRRGVYRNREE